MVVHLGDKLTLKDCPPDMTTKHGRDSAQGHVEVDVFMVVKTRTTVKVIWQDGSEESVRSTDLIPYMNPDEYDCW
jgi:ubiquitin-conjugating enzyme E2 O